MTPHPNRFSAHHEKPKLAYTESGRLSRSAKFFKLLDMTPWPPLPPLPPSIDLIDQTFGRLVVVARAPGRGRGKGSRWVCMCSCGEPKIVGGGDLRAGRVRSCGCLRREQIRALAIAQKTDDNEGTVHGRNSG